MYVSIVLKVPGLKVETTEGQRGTSLLITYVQPS